MRPHAVRHGDRKMRRRRRTDTSVRRYDKHARLRREIQRLPEATRKYGLNIEVQLDALLANRRKAPAPPGAASPQASSSTMGGRTPLANVGLPLKRGRDASRGTPIKRMRGWAAPDLYDGG